MKTSTRRRNTSRFEPLEARQLYSADLIGTAFDVTGGQPLPAGQVSVTFTVKNQNGFWFLDDAGPFTVNIYLSPDQSIGDVSDTLVGVATYNGLGAGQSDTRTIPLSVPATDPYLNDNDYRIGMVIDPSNSVSESNESNNSNQGDNKDGERVWFEGHVQNPANRYGPGGPYFTPGQTLSGAIGGTDERMGGLDIDSYWFHAYPGETYAFDLDVVGFQSNMRVYLSNGALIVDDHGTGAPGEPSGTGDSFCRFTNTYNTYYYVVVCNYANRDADPALLGGRVNAAQGSYTLYTRVLNPAPSAPDLAAASDSGVSNSDNITNSASLGFDFAGAPGQIGQVYIDGVIRATVPNGSPSGGYHATVSGLTDGVHTVTANLLDPTTGYASDMSQPLSITVDTGKPVLAAPDLAAASDSGLSSTDNITNDATPTFTGQTEPNVTIVMYQNGAMLAGGASDGAGNWSITPTIAADGSYAITAMATDLAGNTSVMSPATSLLLDRVGPALTSPMAFQYATAPHRVTMAFSDDVNATISSADLIVLDLATGGTVGAALSYNQSTHAATFSLAAQSQGILARGNYRATINSAGVTDVAGNGVTGNTSLDFFFMPADANHDRAVDIGDLSILATNWQRAGVTFADGDFNYDGRVDISDLAVLASNWQSNLPAQPPPLLGDASSPFFARTTSALILGSADEAY